MKYTGIIFDLDGVICHTDVFHFRAWKSIAVSMGIFFDAQINNRLRGVSRMESLEIILELYEGEPLCDSEKIRIANEKNEIYKSLLMQMDESYLARPVLATLEALRASGVRLAIGSSSKNARLIIERIGLGDFLALSAMVIILNSQNHTRKCFCLPQNIFPCHRQSALS